MWPPSRRARQLQAPSVPMARRQALLLGLVVVTLLSLLGRTAWWQIAQGDMLTQRAAQESLRTLSIPAGRGEILDVNGVALAQTVTRQTVIVDPALLRSTGALTRAVQTLHEAVGLSAATITAQIDIPGEYARLVGADGQPLLLTPEQAAKVSAAIDAAHLRQGIALMPQAIRQYPNGALAAQTLGFVRLSDGVGQYGVEQMENGALGGKPGLLYTRVNANGQPLALPPLRQTSPTPGADVTLTLDANVQLWAEQGLASAVQATHADGGQVVILDPATGGIIAMANATSFNPNHYYNAPLSSFSNPVINTPYDPGSVMKAMTMAAGIQQGVITPQTTFLDRGYTDVSGVRIYNFDRRGHGEENMVQVLTHSANVGAVFVAQQTGARTFYQTLSDFGFFQRTGSGLPASPRGYAAAGTAKTRP